MNAEIKREAERRVKKSKNRNAMETMNRML